MKNLLIISTILLLILQVGFSIQPLTQVSQPESISIEKKSFGWKEKLIKKKNTLIEKGEIAIHKLKTNLINSIDLNRLGRWALIILGVGILCALIGIPLLFVGTYGGSTIVLVLAYVLFIGGILIFLGGIVWGIMWLAFKFFNTTND